MGSKSSKNPISLKEDIGKNDKLNNSQIPQASTKNSSNSGTLENPLKNNE